MSYSISDFNLNVWNDARYKELSPETRLKAVRAIRDGIGDEDKLNLTGIIFNHPDDWYRGCHYGFGMNARNLMRAAGVDDITLPTENLDDYWVPIVEAAVGWREFPEEYLAPGHHLYYNPNVVMGDCIDDVEVEVTTGDDGLAPEMAQESRECQVDDALYLRKWFDISSDGVAVETLRDWSDTLTRLVTKGVEVEVTRHGNYVSVSVTNAWSWRRKLSAIWSLLRKPRAFMETIVVNRPLTDAKVHSILTDIVLMSGEHGGEF